jgi:hypothetical protein
MHIHNIAELTAFIEGQPCLRNAQRRLAQKLNNGG